MSNSPHSRTGTYKVYAYNYETTTVPGTAYYQ